MLASVVSLPDLSAVGRKFRDSNAYLDTPFLFRLRGSDGAELQAPAVELVIAELESTLSTFGIRIVPAPKHDNHSSVDEHELRDVLDRTVNYRREPTLLHDLDALTAIDRLRDGHRQPILEHSEGTRARSGLLLSAVMTIMSSIAAFIDANGRRS